MDAPEKKENVGDLEATVVMTNAPKNTSSGKSGTHFSDIIDGNPGVIDSADLQADSSAEFRHQLENTGKRYKILKMIAQGGFGRIFLAKDLILGREVVIKSLKEEHLVRPASVEKFISEAKLNAQLDHPAIVPLFSLDTDTADGLHLAMQLVNGITLKEYLNRCRDKDAAEKITSRRYERSLQIRLESFLKVCDAIEYCHSRGIIHCDLKPENIMLGKNGEVYVMDWGIACPDRTDRRGNLDGTPAYMAPELFQDGIADPQTDVFALGMILNEIVTLRKPVSGADSKEIIAKIRTGEFEPSTPANPRLRISPALRSIIEKARAVDPAERYRSAKELAADIRHYLFDEEISACPDSPLQKFMRFLHRHRYAALLLIAAIFCASAGLALYGTIRHQCIAAKVTLEMMRRVKVQQVTDRLGTEIDNKLLGIREQLKGLSTSQIIEQNVPEQNPDSARFYLAEDFAPGSAHRPPDLVRTPFYKEEISFGNASYHKPKAMPRQKMMETVKQLRSSRRQGLTLICDSMDDGENIRDYTPEGIFSRFCKNGALLRRITYLMNDGICLRYPGMYEKVAGPDDFQCRWLLERRGKGIRSIQWSPPYPDSSDHAVVACWLPLLTSDGKEKGLVGFELCYHKLIQPILQQVKAEKYQTSYYLLDAEGHQIFSSDDEDFRKSSDHTCRSFLNLNRSFPYPEWLTHFRNGNIPQFIARLRNGKLVRVSIAKIPQANWTLIRVIPPGTVDRINRDLDQRNRQDIEQDIFMERELFRW